jgi:hypothetical protein
MNSDMLKSPLRIALLASAAGFGGLIPVQASTSQDSPRHMTGLINDYSPAHVNGVPVKGAPYEMRGRWSLEVEPHFGAPETATFSAAFNMETTDAGAVNQDDPTTRGAHTHHITMSGPVSPDTSTCPASDPANPPITWQFSVTGTAEITGNGNQAPFQVKSGPSQLQVCVGGGKDGTLKYSNITLMLGAPANTHFGPQPIHGIVTHCGWIAEHEPGECALN